MKPAPQSSFSDFSCDKAQEDGNGKKDGYPGEVDKKNAALGGQGGHAWDNSCEVWGQDIERKDNDPGVDQYGCKVDDVEVGFEGENILGFVDGPSLGEKEIASGIEGVDVKAEERDKDY